MFKLLRGADGFTAEFAFGQVEGNVPNPAVKAVVCEVDGVGWAGQGAGKASDTGREVFFSQGDGDLFNDASADSGDGNGSDGFANSYAGSAKDTAVGVFAGDKGSLLDTVNFGKAFQFFHIGTARHQQVEDYGPGFADFGRIGHYDEPVFSGVKAGCDEGAPAVPVFTGDFYEAKPAAAVGFDSFMVA